MPNQRIVKLFFIVLGFILTLIGLFFDLVNGKGHISLGPLQLASLSVGLVALFTGIAWGTVWGKQIKINIQRFFAREVNCPKRDPKRYWVFDVIFYAIFLFIALAFFVGRWKGIVPVVDLGSDAANVATFAAVLDHPENFLNDFVYYDTGNFKFYVSFHILYLRIVSNIFNDYGLAYLSLIIPIIFIHSVGFYVLGKKLFKNRFFAFLLAILSLIIVYTESSDYWGIYRDPQPRMLFAAFLPWLLLVAFSCLKRPVLRYLTMAIIGLLVYFHPNSAPGIAFAIWLGFLFTKPQGKKVGVHLLEMLGIGLIFFMAAIPFMTAYMGSRDLILSGMDYDTALVEFKTLGMAMFRLGETLLRLLKIFISTLLLPLAVIAWFVGWLKLEQKTEIKLIVIWILGLLFVGCGIPFLEAFIDEKLQIMPVLLDLNRNLRYIVPLLEISILLPLAGYANRIQIKNRKGVMIKCLVTFLSLGIVIILCMGFRKVTKDMLGLQEYAQQAVTCWMQGNFFCEDTTGSDEQELLAYIRENTNIDDGFISIPPLNLKTSRQIRYQGLRSIVFEISDDGVFLASNMTEYFAIKPDISQWETIETIKDDEERFLAYLDFADEHGADYAVVSSTDARHYIANQYSVVFTSGDYAIIEMP